MDERRQTKRNKQKKKIKIKRLILVMGVIVLVFGLIFGASFFIYQWQHSIATKGLVADQSDLLGVLNLEQATEEEKSLLDDYELVRKMLMSQEMHDYPQALVLKINEQNQIIIDKIKAQTLVDLEDAINNLAALIDQPLFSGNPGEVFYARGLLILNKEHKAPENFEPGNRRVMVNAFAQMQKAAAEQGVNLHDFSNYRSYYAQETLFNRYVATDGEQAANRYSAKPGYSEHQTGFVMDIGGDNRAAWAETTFDNTREAKWLAENAHKYGFILRYPPGKEDVTGYIYESWHFRYVGGIAAKIKESGLTLEEYLGLI